MTTGARPIRRQRLLIAIAAFLVLFVAGGLIVWQRYITTYHLATVQEGVLYRDGARSISDLNRALAAVHPKTVVCLVDDQELADPGKPQFKEEMAMLTGKAIRVERIPVTLGGWPDTTDVRKFLKVATDPVNQPVLVHCAQGVRRTAMMVAAYQESVLGYNPEKTKAAILTFGHSDKTVNDIRRFIDGYDPATRTVTLQVAAIDRSEK